MVQTSSVHNDKVIQLYETNLVRHGIMCVGPSGSGKSAIIQCLQDSLTIHSLTL